MRIEYHNLTLRNAVPEDAHTLGEWWRDGKVMAHAGFPLGLAITDEEIAASLMKDSEDIHRHLLAEMDGAPIGEMNYRNMGDGMAEIGIKICDASKQNHGAGKVLLSLLINALFAAGYQKIILDTNLENRRAQHVYESLGFRRLHVNENAWRDQLGRLQSSVDYELYEQDFVSFAR